MKMRFDIDPVVEEIRQTRRDIYARCGNDLHQYGQLLIAAGTQRKAQAELLEKRPAVKKISVSRSRVKVHAH
jgi:hypothetical protein